MKKICATTCAIAVTATAIIGTTMLTATPSEAREQIRIVGSSTVYPFTTVAAEQFGNNTDYKTPIVESTGTGGGFKLFCAGIGEKFPDFSNASRMIKQTEVEMCAANGVKEIAELKIGFDGIVMANSKETKQYSLTLNQIFKALAKQLPQEGKLIDNPYTSWNDIDPTLPATKISVYGPPPTSGTRDAFVELVMEKACKDLPEFKAAFPDKKARKKACHLLREDGAYIEAGENDNVIVQKLKANADALGIFGFSFLEENSSALQGSLVDNVSPSFDNISSGKYPVSRSLFVYAKAAHAKVIKGMKEFTAELTSSEAIGDEGYLLEKGLIPLTEIELTKTQTNGKSVQ
ncbi:MAG: PstS family phosphate ABC transporter substrate-binding protein [Rickettsiales bacterium]|nr:PstS family phosphate ABC transporter substrate-binding protein [Rickettsiales bacterium]